MIDKTGALRDLLTNVAVLEHHDHSRCRVYPQDVGATITLVAGAAANTFGNWTPIIPLTTIGFGYEVVGLVIEAANKTTTYLIQLGFSTVALTEPTTAQILGERRVLLPSPIGKTTELLDYYSQDCPANAKLWGKVKSATVTADELEVSVVVIRHQEITNPIPMLTTWPWHL
ncbi:unnamed protein product [marine sediment metagenome]|uniref:Uncharacterized protein n=1 Tax=marine sediment metagenome TaxID=412755 RepID=X1BED4_9ZZZZ